MMNFMDVFKFGKHKGKALADVMQSDPTYLSWLRSEKIKEGKNAFTVAVDKELSDALKRNKAPFALRPRAQSKGAPVTADSMNALAEKAASEEARRQEELEEHSKAYKDTWGVW